MSATCQFGLKIGDNLTPCQQYLKPDDAEKATTSPQCQQNPPSKSQGPQNYEGRGQEGTYQAMCSVSLLAIGLKGLAAPGEALKYRAYDASNIQNKSSGSSPPCPQGTHG